MMMVLNSTDYKQEMLRMELNIPTKTTRKSTKMAPTSTTNTGFTLKIGGYSTTARTTQSPITISLTPMIILTCN